jgi:hypothetical protein
MKDAYYGSMKKFFGDLDEARQRVEQDLQAEFEAALQIGIERGMFPDPKQLSPPVLHIWTEELGHSKNSTMLGALSGSWDRAQERIKELRELAKSQAIQQDKAEDKPNKADGATKTRGMKAGTENRVREAHRLMRSGLSQRQATKRAHTDPSTYKRWCKEVTGEEPIEPYR